MQIEKTKYLSEKARDYVNHYREKFIEEAKKGNISDVKQFLDNECGFKEFTQEEVYTDYTEASKLAAFYGVLLSDVEGKLPKDALPTILKNYRQDLLIYARKDLVECLTFDIQELESGASVIETSLGEYDQEDAGDLALYRDDVKELEDMRLAIDNLKKVNVLLSTFTEV